MNRTLIDPFVLAQEYPERRTGSFRWGPACCLAFSPSGFYLAVGHTDGNVQVIDTDTWGVFRELDGHVAPIQSFAWHSDESLVSASRDWNCIRWNLRDQTPASAQAVNVDGPVWQVAIPPDTANTFSAARYEAVPVVGAFPGNNGFQPVETDGKTFTTTYTPDGRYVLFGGSKGVTFVDSNTKKVVAVEKLAKGNIKQIIISPQSQTMVTNSTDRTIRVFKLPDFAADPATWSFTLVNKFIDNVNRQQYNAITVTPSGEYLLALAADDLHNIYMWEAATGTLVRMYDAPEELLTMEFHPKLPLIVAAGADTGTVYQWTLVAPQQWSALAPDFAELQENEPYYEMEDEFDIVDDEVLRSTAVAVLDKQVDVYTREHEVTANPIIVDLYK